MVAAVILAGGKGRRLGGVIKHLLVVDGRRIIDRQLSLLRPLFEQVAIVISDAGMLTGVSSLDADVPLITDRQGPGLGPLAGLDAALAWLPPRFQSVVLVAGDMPFLTVPVLQRLRDAAPAPAVVPRPQTGPQPLCARYDRVLAPLVAAELAAGTRAMHQFLDRVAERVGTVSWIEETELRRLDPQLETFVNINTPDDLSSG